MLTKGEIYDLIVVDEHFGSDALLLGSTAIRELRNKLSNREIIISCRSSDQPPDKPSFCAVRCCPLDRNRRKARGSSSRALSRQHVRAWRCDVDRQLGSAPTGAGGSRPPAKLRPPRSDRRLRALLMLRTGARLGGDLGRFFRFRVVYEMLEVIFNGSKHCFNL